MLRATFADQCEELSNVELLPHGPMKSETREKTTPHFLTRLKCFQPFQDGAVFSPCNAPLARNRMDARDGLAFHFQINGGVAVGGIQAGMPQPLTNG